MINNAGYFMEACEKVNDDSLDFEEQMKQIKGLLEQDTRPSIGGGKIVQPLGLINGSEFVQLCSSTPSCLFGNMFNSICEDLLLALRMGGYSSHPEI